MQRQRLGVNIDHVATIRNARGGHHPDPVRAALLAVQAGADSITAHLREDRRHIRDADIAALKAQLSVPLNLEMAATHEMQAIALATLPHAVCLVPEKREERTTEGGLDVVGQQRLLRDYIAPLSDMGIRVSLFIDPVEAQLEAALTIGAKAVEIHTGAYCDAYGEKRLTELAAIQHVAALSASMPLECHAGHGLSFDNVAPIAAIADIVELNIGHFLMGEAMFMGLDAAIKRMRSCMDDARRAYAA
ncbi:MAG: pyridoxine 5'-phosphate synthase [Alphaproteobacteria bacterium]|nr:pyridoxine 5'-phosphate synthase [Alphaproteobacteria bacterium]